MLIKHIRNESGHPYGVVIAQLIGDEVYVGWSLVNTKKGDRYNKRLGKNIATGRVFNMQEIANGSHEVPIKAVIPILDMYERARRYFKQAKNMPIDEFHFSTHKQKVS